MEAEDCFLNFDFTFEKKVLVMSFLLFLKRGNGTWKIPLGDYVLTVFRLAHLALPGAISLMFVCRHCAEYTANRRWQ